MTIRELELTNFRSYVTAKFELHPAVTLVVGPNASGKTNLLESLYVLASTRSFRAKDRDLIRHGEDYMRIVATSDVEYALGAAHGNVGIEKRITHDGVKRTQVAHVGHIQVTLFEPTDLLLVSGAPEGRRKYLDFILCQTDRGYLKTLQLYRRVLKHRNALLDGFEVSGGRDQIFTWDIQLAELALEIYQQRTRLLDNLNSALPHLYADIAGAAEQLELTYQPSVNGDAYGDAFLETLARNLPRDLAAGFTTIGPHREDFTISFKNSPVEAVASRGEVRTLVLSLKLAELDYAEKQTKLRPLLLLDDVFSELDRDRRGYLIERLRDHQTVITTTDADAVTREIGAGHKIIHTELNRV
ncbi:DNA replication/repair protein RecF [Candidatus Saccharibacteria bacterium]|nr:DNA replication/repair protein RecF [Candidatus Saccharibacteria bacterium]